LPGATAAAAAIETPAGQAEVAFWVVLAGCLVVGMLLALAFVEIRQWEGVASSPNQEGHPPLLRGLFLVVGGAGMPGIFTGTFGLKESTLNYAVYVLSFALCSGIGLWRKKIKFARGAKQRLVEAGMPVEHAKNRADTLAEDFLAKGTAHCRAELDKALDDQKQDASSELERFVMFVIGMSDGISAKFSRANPPSAEALIGFLEQNINLFLSQFLTAGPGMKHPQLRACIYIRPTNGKKPKNSLVFLAGSTPEHAPFSFNPLPPDSFAGRVASATLDVYYPTERERKSMKKRKRAEKCQLVSACPIRRINPGFPLEGALCIDKLGSDDHWGSAQKKLIVLFAQVIDDAIAVSGVEWDDICSHLARLNIATELPSQAS
jgi:hypothetical protein